MNRKSRSKQVSHERVNALLDEMNACLVLYPPVSAEFKAGYRDTVFAHINGKRVRCPYPKKSAARDAFWYGYEKAREMIQRVEGSEP